MGEHRQKFVGSGGTATLDFDMSASTSWGRKTVSSVLWDVDGGTIVSGTETSFAISVEFDPGFYEVKCLVMDDKGKSRIGYRYVWINTKDPTDANAPFSYRFPCLFTSDVQDRIGRTIGLEIQGGDISADVFNGQAFLITEDPTFDGESLDDPDLIVDSFFGYMATKDSTIRGKGSKVNYQLMSPLTLAKLIPTATQQLQETSSPSIG